MAITEDEILRAWNIGEHVGIEVPYAGVSNHTRLVRTGGGDFVLRGYRHARRQRVEAEHATIAHVRGRGVPAPEVVALPDGQTVLEMEGRFWALFRRIPGRQVRRPHISLAEVAAMGRMLGRVHAALADHPGEVVCRTSAGVDLPRTLGLIAKIEQAIARMDTPGSREQRVLQRLACQREWLEGARREIDVPGPVQVIHYDYQETNVLFEGEQVVGVLDWDDSGLGPRSYDILRAMHLMLSLQPQACRAFLEGYRQGQSLPDEELLRGAAYYGLARDCSTWLYEEVYLLDNQRVRERFEPEPFVPFERSWQVFARAMQLG